MRAAFCLGIVLFFIPHFARGADVPLASTPVPIRQTDTRLEADLIAPNGVLEFRSARQPSGDLVISLAARFGEERRELQAVIPENRQSVQWIGNGQTLTPPIRDAIRRLAAELEGRMRRPGVQPLEEWAFRVASYWGEAPLRFPIQTRTTRRPDVESNIAGDEFSAETSQRADGRAAARCEDGCNVDSDDGIVYLEGSGENEACRAKWYQQTKHDACDRSTGTGHCYGVYPAEGGCDGNAGCRGRCGAGCSFTGFGIYTKDCLEHDHCVEHEGAAAFNPKDKECGDEWIDAADDFTWGKYNCSGCT